MMLEDTICAPATPPISSPIAVIRISGPMTQGVVKSIFNRPKDIIPRHAIYGSIVWGDEIVDDVILIYYQSPCSFTGEDMVDIFCHGNPIIIRNLIRLLNQSGVRVAEPGEFSKRSFLNGKIDITEAEAINHIINARSEWEVSSAIKQMHGSLRDNIDNIRDRIILIKADIESGIDFIEEDIEPFSYEEVLRDLAEIRGLISDLIRRCKVGERLTGGVDIPIIGRPNVGKSSILNLILNSERAIVTDIPGTTRDLIKEVVQFAGMRINLIDTAGIGLPTCEIEEKGIDLSNKKMESASIIIMVIDVTMGVIDEDWEIINRIENKKKIILANKTDLVTRREALNVAALIGDRAILFSAKNGIGLVELEREITDILRNEFVGYENSFVADIRIINILETMEKNIDDSEGLLLQRQPLEIVAFELQGLIDNLSEITGKILPDDVLDSIFRRFCIGK